MKNIEYKNFKNLGLVSGNFYSIIHNLIKIIVKKIEDDWEITFYDELMERKITEHDLEFIKDNFWIERISVEENDNPNFHDNKITILIKDKEKIQDLITLIMVVLFKIYK